MKTILKLLIITSLLGNNALAANQLKPTTLSKDIASNNPNITIIKMVHSDKSNSIRGKSAIRFKEMLEARFPNRIKVELYENSSLYKEEEELEALDLGVVNLLITPSDKISESYKIKDLQLFNMPFLISSDSELKKLIYGQTGTDLANIVNSKTKTLQLIGYWSEGYKVFTGKEFYTNPIKFKNKNFISTAPNMNKFTYNSFSANVNNNSMNKNNKDFLFNDNSKIDIADISLSSYYDLGVSNNLKYVTEVNHAFTVDLVISNKRWFSALPEDIRNGIIAVTKETSDYSIELSNKDNDVIKNNLQKNGIKFYTLNDKEKEQFKKMSIPIHSNFLKENKELLLEAYQEIKNK